MTQTTTQRQARAAAIRKLDRYWPAKRGQDVAQADAYKAIRDMFTGFYEFDFAGMDARLIDFMSAGLLGRRVHDSAMEYVYIRPLTDVEPPEPKPQVTMFVPWDGGEPRPWSEVSAEIAARRNNPPEPADLTQQAVDALRNIPVEVMAAAGYTKVDPDKKGRRSWLSK